MTNLLNKCQEARDEGTVLLCIKQHVTCSSQMMIGFPPSYVEIETFSKNAQPKFFKAGESVGKTDLQKKQQKQQKIKTKGSAHHLRSTIAV